MHSGSEAAELESVARRSRSWHKQWVSQLLSKAPVMCRRKPLQTSWYRCWSMCQSAAPLLPRCCGIHGSVSSQLPQTSLLRSMHLTDPPTATEQLPARHL